MTSNVGKKDRIVRFVLGLLLMAAPVVSGMPVFDGSVAATVAVIAGLVLVVTAFVRFCPLYRILGVNTCSI